MDRSLFRKITAVVTVWLASLAIALMLGSTEWGRTADNIYYDGWHQACGRRDFVPSVTIVSVDNESFLDPLLKDDPLVFWGPHFAVAIENLKNMGAKAIGLDFLFLTSAENWIRKVRMSRQDSGPDEDLGRSYDSSFRQQLSGGGIVLAGLLAKTGDGRAEILMAPFDYWAVMPGMVKDTGITNMLSDGDGVVRRFIPVFNLRQEPETGFATLLASMASGKNPDKLMKETNPDKKAGEAITIGYKGPPGKTTFPRISFSEIIRSDSINDQKNVNLVKDRIIIISEEHAGMQDVHQTPYSRIFFGRKGELMTGAEVHANIIETLITGDYPESPENSQERILVASVILASSMIFVFSAPLAGAASGAFMGVLCAVLSFAAFYNGIRLSVFPVQAGISVSYLFSLWFHFRGSEKRRLMLKEIFGRYVSGTVVEKLAEGEHLPYLGGENIEITILFSDIRNFTRISEILSAQEVVEMLNAYFEQVCTVIQDEGGTVDKFIGDAVMALFGAPVRYPDHSARALRTAVKMRRKVEKFREWMKYRFSCYEDLPDFDSGIGIHTGNAVAGNIGSTKRLDYTAIGDSVNIASRIESETRNLKWPIAASVETVNAAAGFSKTTDFFRFGATRTVLVKGREKAVTVIEIRDSGLPSY